MTAHESLQPPEVRDHPGPSGRALLELFELLDAEDWERLVAHLDDDVQLADELTGSWLRGRDAVAGYLRAQRGVVTGIRSRVEDLHVSAVTGDLSLVTFHMQQSYRLVGRERSESLTGCCLLRTGATGWSLLLFDLGSVNPATETDGTDETDETDEAAGSVPDADPHPAASPRTSLGERIKSLRARRGMTLRALADRTQMSPGFLSEVERDLADPSVGSLLRIADGLDVPAATLVERPGRADRLVVSHAHQRSAVPLNAGALSVATLDGPGGSSLIAHLRTYRAPVADSGDAAEAEPHDSVFFVTRGRAELEHHGQAVPIQEEDAVTLLAGAEYRILPRPGQPVTVLVVSRAEVDATRGTKTAAPGTAG